MPGRLSRKQVRLLWIVGAGSALAFGLVLLLFVAFPVLGLAKNFRIPNEGMAPALQPDDFIYARLERGLEPERNAIIFFDPPDHPLSTRYRGIWVSRCVGFPGDTLEVIDGEVLVNGVLVGLRPPRGKPGDPDPFARSLTGPSVIPPECYFVTGDNYRNSFDSRYYGYVERDLVRGVPVGRLWPLSRFGKIR